MKKFFLIFSRDQKSLEHQFEDVTYDSNIPLYKFGNK